MRASGGNPAFKKRALFRCCECAVHRQRRAAIACPKKRHFLAVYKASPNLCFDRCFRLLRNSGDNREIHFLDRTFFKLCLECITCCGIFGNEQTSRSSLIEAVCEGERGERVLFLELREKRINVYALRLIDDEAGSIFVEDDMRPLGTRLGKLGATRGDAAHFDSAFL